MVKEVKMYAVFCDHCGKQFIDEFGTGFSAWTDKADVVEASMQDGWAVLHGRHICPECYHFDDETDEIVENDFTKEDE